MISSFFILIAFLPFAQGILTLHPSRSAVKPTHLHAPGTANSDAVCCVDTISTMSGSWEAAAGAAV